MIVVIALSSFRSENHESFGCGLENVQELSTLSANISAICISPSLAMEMFQNNQIIINQRDDKTEEKTPNKYQALSLPAV
jgi:hypothetical protein